MSYHTVKLSVMSRLVGKPRGGGKSMYVYDGMAELGEQGKP